MRAWLRILGRQPPSFNFEYSSSDAALQATLAADVATLRAQFPETRALYREVCALWFFR